MYPCFLVVLSGYFTNSILVPGDIGSPVDAASSNEAEFMTLIDNLSVATALRAGWADTAGRFTAISTGFNFMG